MKRIFLVVVATLVARLLFTLPTVEYVDDIPGKTWPYFIATNNGGIEVELIGINQDSVTLGQYNAIFNSIKVVKCNASTEILRHELFHWAIQQLYLPSVLHVWVDRYETISDKVDWETVGQKKELKIL